MIRIRVDDFPHTKHEERDRHNLTSFRDFDRLLRMYLGDRRYLLGAIPMKCTPDDLVYLRDETGCRIGMHGVWHDERLLDLYQNEFEPYLTRSAVRAELEVNRVNLEKAVGRPVDIYMPPRNLIDRRTIAVLTRAGFSAYTSGPETPADLRSGGPGLTCIDSRPPHEYGRSDELLTRRSHDELIWTAKEDKTVTLTLHWTWETNIGLDHLRRFLDQIDPKLFGSF